MAYRIDEFAPGEIYHIFNRGVEKRSIFLDNSDRLRFIELLTYSLAKENIQSYSTAKRLRRKIEPTEEGDGLVDLLCYCLMKNHFHLLIRENVEGGITAYMKRLLIGYSKYFNTKQQRSGSLFIHPFKAVVIDGDDQLLHVSRYIHLNPYVAHITDTVSNYRWSSYGEYTEKNSPKICHQELLLSFMGQ
ncbi:MAG: transposase, partial [Patescibacteria group bacterium]